MPYYLQNDIVSNISFNTIVGQQLGYYRLIHVLGQGAFARVYLGEHQYLERLAAIKVLHVRMQPENQESFRREARTIAQLRHPHIIDVHDFGISDQTPYLVMEYTQGGTLRDLCPRGTRLPFEQIVAYVKQIASALDYAHEQHVIHRDVKPENILLSTDHEVVLSDFGLAGVQHGQGLLSIQDPAAGTPIYMAPEQYQQKPCAASDQYALGVIVYEWLCGEPPFQGSYYEVLNQHLYRPPPSLCAHLPHLPPTAEIAVFRALAKDPQQRFSSVADFATALEEAFAATQPLSPHEWLVREARGQTALPTTHVPLVSVPPANKPESSPSPLNVRRSLAQRNRQRLLESVRSFWIKGVFEESLHGAALMALGLETQPGAVDNPWQLLLQHSDLAPRPLPGGTPIMQVYDDAQGELLILGAPGAGKTTLLLELARGLLERAERDEYHPVPVVFNLSSWALKRQPLGDWLVEELVNKYQVPLKLARVLVNADQILPLLDGLDEVAPSERTACIEAINFYRQQHGLLPLVVSSRSADYLAQTTHVHLRSAVTIQPLAQQQIESYLASAGQQGQALREALGQDKYLRELATTPLMLAILLLVYRGAPSRKINELTSLEAKQEQIFTLYVQYMLQRRGASQRYRPEQITHWLGYLAGQMKRQNQTEFHLERIQPDWLAGKSGRRFSYPLLTKLLTGLFAGLLGGLVLLVMWFPINLLTNALTPTTGAEAAFVPSPGSIWILGAFGALLSGLMTGLVTGLLHRQGPEIEPAEVLRWSWKDMRRSLKTDAFLKGGLLTWLLFGLLFGLSVWLFDELAVFVFWPDEASVSGKLFDGLVAGLWSTLLALFCGFALWSIGGTISEYVASSPHPLLARGIQLKPRQKRQGSGRKQRGFLVGLASGLVCGPLSGLLTTGHFAILMGLILTISASTSTGPPQEVPLIVWQGAVGLVVAITLLTGLANGLFMARTYHMETTLNPLQALVRLWRGIVQGLVTNEVLRRGVLISLVMNLASGLLIVLFFQQYFGQILASLSPALPLNQILFWLVSLVLLMTLDLGLFFASLFGLIRGITRGLSSNMLDTRAITRPNQGIRRSVRNSMVVGLVSLLGSMLVFTFLSVLVFGSSIGLLGTLVGQQPSEQVSQQPSGQVSQQPGEQVPQQPGEQPSGPVQQPNWLVLGVFMGLTLGVSFGQYIGLVAGLENGLFYGGSAFIRHRVLRFYLSSAGYIPRDYVRFLDYAAERILLRKVGGGYIFVHRLLLDYFAALETKVVSNRAVAGKQNALSPHPTSSLYPCGHERRAHARFCAVCGKPVV